MICSDLAAVTPPAAARSLLAAIVRPASMAALEAAQWDLLIRQARRTRLLPRLAAEVERLDLATPIPGPAADILHSATLLAEDNRRMLLWEMNRIRRALRDLDQPVVLLKGGAYAAAGLPIAKGRTSSDLDILVPKDKLTPVEAALMAHGWRHIKFSDYDQRYYRRWMHELPPMLHQDRQTLIDVHHTILPLSGRLSPDPAALWAESRDTAFAGLKVLGPEDMVLHSAAHLFQDGDLNFAIRDLVDLVGLIRQFEAEPGFWSRLIERAERHGLQRPLFYTLRYGTALLELETPETIAPQLTGMAPPGPILRLMDRMAPQVLLPGHPDTPESGRASGALLLYLRSHWLRMPPWLLAQHLARKAFVRLYYVISSTWRDQPT